MESAALQAAQAYGNAAAKPSEKDAQANWTPISLNSTKEYKAQKAMRRKGRRPVATQR